MDRHALGTRIKALRQRRGLTQRELARQAAVTHAYVVMLEGGKRSNPSFGVLARLAKGLGVPLSTLVKGKRA